MTAIYYIKCIITNKKYVGSAKCIRTRFANHRWALRNNKHGNPYLQRAWDKYGENNFTFTVLQECDENELRVLEQVHYDKIKPEFNIGVIVATPWLGRHHSEETKEILRKKGRERVFTKEWRRRISEANTGKINGPHSDEIKLKMSITKKPKMKAVVQCDLEGNILNTFESICEACRVTGITKGSIYSSCSLGGISRKKYRWNWFK